MNKFIFLFFSIFFSVLCYSQTDISDIIKPRKSFVSIKKESLIFKNSNRDYVIINNDTLVGIINNTIYNDSILIFNNSKLASDINTYKRTVFYYTNENSKHIYYLRQWSVPIVIYFDKKLPKEMINQLKQFILKFNEIKNLNISFTKQLKNANYFIKVVSTKIENKNIVGYFDKNEDATEFVFTNCDYKLLSDSTKKTVSCRLLVNLNKDISIFTANIKQAFYLSLGRFFINTYGRDNPTSLINMAYKNNETINEQDLNLLKIHYSQIYDQKINGTTFNKLMKLSKKNK